MATNYYCLVAGLREYTLDGDVKGFDARVVIEEIAEALSKADRKALAAHLLFWDVCNMVNVRNGRDGFSTLGNLSREELVAELECPTVLPAELREVIELYAEVAGGEVDADDERLLRIDTARSFEASLFGAYYRYCAKNRCRFVREWAEADRNLRNITAAVTARQRGMTIGEVVVGEGDVVAQLSRSSAVDFGLKGELTYIDNLIAALGDNQDLLDKEHRIDLIRWNMAEELATFDYFNINYLLSYVARLGLVHRWAMLDAERGKEMFRRLVGSLGAKEQIAEAESRYAAE